jgi:hypothetical protein
MHYCFCRQKRTSQFLFFLKPCPLPPHFLVAILSKENNIHILFSVTCAPTIISLIPLDLNRLDLDGQAEKS